MFSLSRIRRIIESNVCQTKSRLLGSFENILYIRFKDHWIETKLINGKKWFMYSEYLTDTIYISLGQTFSFYIRSVSLSWELRQVNISKPQKENISFRVQLIVRNIKVLLNLKRLRTFFKIFNFYNLFFHYNKIIDKEILWTLLS